MLFYCFLLLIFFIRCSRDKAKALESGDDYCGENTGDHGDASFFYHSYNCEEADGANDTAYDLKSEYDALHYLGFCAFCKGIDES